MCCIKPDWSYNKPMGLLGSFLGGATQCISTRSTCLGFDSLASWQSKLTDGTSRGGYFGCANATAERPNVFVVRTCETDSSRVAGVPGTRMLQKRFGRMVTHLAGRTARFTIRGHRCTAGAKIQTTTDSIDTEAEELSCVIDGRNLRRFLRTWGRRGLMGCQLTESTTMETTSRRTAAGQHRKNRRQTGRHIVAGVGGKRSSFIAVKPIAKKNGGGWERETFG